MIVRSYLVRLPCRDVNADLTKTETTGCSLSARNNLPSRSFQAESWVPRRNTSKARSLLKTFNKLQLQANKQAKSFILNKSKHRA